MYLGGSGRAGPAAGATDGVGLAGPEVGVSIGPPMTSRPCEKLRLETGILARAPPTHAPRPPASPIDLRLGIWFGRFRTFLCALLYRRNRPRFPRRLANGQQPYPLHLWQLVPVSPSIHDEAPAVRRPAQRPRPLAPRPDPRPEGVAAVAMPRPAGPNLSRPVVHVAPCRREPECRPHAP